MAYEQKEAYSWGARYFFDIILSFFAELQARLGHQHLFFIVSTGSCAFILSWDNWAGLATTGVFGVSEAQRRFLMSPLSRFIAWTWLGQEDTFGNFYCLFVLLFMDIDKTESESGIFDACTLFGSKMSIRLDLPHGSSGACICSKPPSAQTAPWTQH